MPVVLLLSAGLGFGAVWGKKADVVDGLRRARDAWEAGEPVKALDRLQSLHSDELGDHVQLLRAGWLRDQGQLEAALEAGQEALRYSPPSEVRARIQHEIAQVHLKRGSLAAAYRAQRGAWENTHDSDYAVQLADELARAFEEQGLPGDALALYRRAWQTWPAAAGSEQLFERSLELARATGAAEPPPAAIIARAESLKRSGRFEPALNGFQESLARPGLDDELRKKAENAAADCLFSLRRYDEAAAAYERATRLDPKNYRAAIQSARAHARSGDVALGIERLKAVARRAPPAQRARARYLLALLLEDREPKTSHALMAAVQKQTAARDLSRSARWNLAWEEILDRKYEAAQRRLQPLTRGSIHDVEVQRARYWTAMALLELNAEQGREHMLRLAEELPLSYYGLMAAERLDFRPEIERSFVGKRAEHERYPSRLRAGWLAQAGFEDSARYELASWIANPKLDRSERLAAADSLHGVGEHFRAVRIVIDGFGGALEQGIDPLWSEAWKLAWPRPFAEPVRKATQEFGFDWALVYAIMREESTYRPEVTSPAGALGLMQIIPPTGERIARSLGNEAFHSDQLFEPPTNIRFGTFYLNDLARRFDGSSELAIAAYNAGPQAVSGWISKSGARARDAFVESVPYGETRRYLRRVLRSYHMYRLLYGSETAAQPSPETSR